MISVLFDRHTPLFNIKESKPRLPFCGSLKKQDTDTFERMQPGKSGIVHPDAHAIETGYTYMFRDDLKWGVLSDYIEERFRRYKKVNVINYACSKGCEPYSLAILIKNKMKENESDKFFPIIAKDIGKKRIETNKNNQKNKQVPMIISEYMAMCFMLNMNKEDGLQYADEKDKKYFLKDDIVSCVKFECANILEDIDSLDSNNPSLIMCRNMWPYVNEKEYANFAARLYDKLAAGSCVVIGDYDYDFDYTDVSCGYKPVKISECLEDAGFEPAKAVVNSCHNLIYEKN